MRRGYGNVNDGCQASIDVDIRRARDPANALTLPPVDENFQHQDFKDGEIDAHIICSYRCNCGVRARGLLGPARTCRSARVRWSSRTRRPTRGRRPRRSTWSARPHRVDGTASRTARELRSEQQLRSNLQSGRSFGGRDLPRRDNRNVERRRRGIGGVQQHAGTGARAVHEAMSCGVVT